MQYIDFNQVVHHATHPPDRPVPPDRAAAFRAVFRAFDRLVLAAKPRRLLVVAFDGVAPRAKMNQQRARRFLAARERGAELASQSAAAIAWGVPPPAEAFDHNAITPGTEFMAELGAALRQHIASRVAAGGAFGSLTIVLSDAAVAGEGEHKIAAIVRAQRAQPGYDPSTTHLLYGLDADLVMIGLATHERRFYLLRDWVPLGRERFIERCDLCGREGHRALACPILSATRAAQTEEQRVAAAAAVDQPPPLLLLSSLPPQLVLSHFLAPTFRR